MKSLFSIALIGLLGILAGCSTTEETMVPASTAVNTPGSTTSTMSGGSSTTNTSGQTGLLEGTFVSNVHTTSGTVKLVETTGKRTLIFTNFRTDGGPDLRIYLAENTGLRNFIEVSRLDNSGNFSVDLPAAADPSRQRYVLIWCKAFSVLFGNAELK